MDATFVWKLGKLGRLGSSRLRYDDDFVDRLNYQFTGIILFLFIGLISIRQYIGKPIQCWVPQEFTRGWEEYAENYCWVASTYYAALRGQLPHKVDRQRQLLGYYQWAPIFLALQALLCYLPCLAWRALSGRCPGGLNLRRLMQMAAATTTIGPTCAPGGGGPGGCDAGPDYGLHPPSTAGPGAAAAGAASLNNPSCKYMGRYITSCIVRRQLRSQMHMHSHHHHPQQHHHGSSRAAWSTGGKLPNSRMGPPRGTDHGGGGGGGSSNSSSVIDGDMKPSSPLGGGGTINGRCCPCWCLRPSPSVKSTTTGGTVTVNPGGGGGRMQGCYLVSLYLCIKVLYLANVLLQLYLMQRFIGTRYRLYGLRLLIDLVKGQHWYSSGHFPRVTFCDMEAKKLGKNNMYTLQCVLPMNMFLEKIFIFLWFWHVLLGAVTAISGLCWSACLLSPRRRIRFVRQQLRVSGSLRETDLGASRQFVLRHLRPDIVLVLRLMGSNLGELLVTDLTAELWYIYRHHHYQHWQQRPNNDHKPPISATGTGIPPLYSTYHNHPLHHHHPHSQHPSLHHHHHPHPQQHHLHSHPDSGFNDMKMSPPLVGNSTNNNNNNNPISTGSADKNGFGNNNQDDIV